MRQLFRNNKIITLLIGWTVVSTIWFVASNCGDRVAFEKSLQYGDFWPQWQANDVEVGKYGLFWTASVPQFSPWTHEYQVHQKKTFFVPPGEFTALLQRCKKHEVFVQIKRQPSDKIPYAEALVCLVPGLLASAFLARKRRRGGITRLGCGKQHGVAAVSEHAENKYYMELKAQELKAQLDAMNGDDADAGHRLWCGEQDEKVTVKAAAHQ
jgi:hypothetical protein